MTVKLCIGTKKGAFILTSEDRIDWKVSDPILFGQIVYHMVPDHRDNQTILIATKTGHLGPTVFRSHDGGKTWKEAEEPPKFQSDKSVDFVFWLTPGNHDDPDVWWAGTSPQGLFRSEDNGNTWQEFKPFNDNDLIKSVTKDNGGTPIGPLTHSIRVDPLNKDHMIVALSSGGVFVTEDYGQSWTPWNKNVLADFLPDPYPEVGHCVHNLQLHPKEPHLMYQQGHCGVYRIDTSQTDTWERIGDNMPKEIGDIGFPLILHPTDPDKLWIIPMDGTDVWPRTSVDGKPAVYQSKDGGKSWERLDNGFPESHAFFTVLRQAATHDYEEDLGLYFGNKAGEIWACTEEDTTWKAIVRHIPDVYSIEPIV